MQAAPYIDFADYFFKKKTYPEVVFVHRKVVRYMKNADQENEEYELEVLRFELQNRTSILKKP